VIPTTCKRLIEVDFPIAAVSAHSAREKYIREGHPSTLHLWWARRPLAACRAVLLGLLLPDPCDKDCPLDFKTAARELLAKRYGIASKTDGELREMLLKFIGEFANWDHAANALYLEIGRGLVKAAHPEETPVVVDPFAGGGSIPLEALRLGCEAFASDLNPVACLILKTLLEDIPRYGNAEFKLKDDKGKEIVVHGLADALRHVGKQVKEAAEQDLAQFYPPEPDGSQAIAYLWARTVRCEGIGCGAEIPLVRSLWLSKKPERRRALCYCIRRPKDEPPQIVFEILQPKTEEEVGAGFVAGGKATCPYCNVVLPAVRVRAQLTAQRGVGDAQFDKKGQRVGGAILLAVVTLRADTSGRVYRLPLDRDYVAVWKARMAADKLPEGIIPDEPVNPVRPSPNARGLSAVTRFGIVTFGDLFTVRQKLTLAALGRQCAKAEPEMRFALALATSRVSERLTTLSRWDNSAKMESIAGTFSRQALQFVWDFAEQNPFKEIGGNWDGAVDWIALVAGEGGTGSVGQVALADACASPLIQGSVDLWFTDPPYYDSIPYADLSDFFFVWLKRALPNHALLNARGDPGTGLTPKTEECVWNQSHFVDGQPKDGAFFERTITRAFLEGRRVLKADGISCVVFAHKTTEGWEALLSGMFRAGFVITASWPVTTEMATRAVARDTAALAGSVHLVCRPRSIDAGVGDWTIVKAAMEKRIREWLPTLVKHGVRGADAIFSCLGPALESYSKYEKVLTAADREVPLGGDPDAIEPEQRGFLAYVFETLSKEALRQVLGDAETEGFEEDSRMTALFLWTLQATKTNGNGKKPEISGQKSEVSGEEEPEDEEEEDKPKKAKAGFSMPFDTFIRITRPMGIHYAALKHRVIEIEKGIVRLLPVRERSEQLLGEAATRPGLEISLEDVKQMELGLLTQRQQEAALLSKPKRGQKSKPAPGKPQGEATFTTLDRLHRAMLLFSLGRSTLLRQVLETELHQSQRFERLAFALNALYPENSDDRRMLEGVQAAMRGVK
jgi:adenine-specific DNA methylase